MKKLLISVLIIATLLASGCISDEDAAIEKQTENIILMDAVPRIPREVLFGNPDKASAHLSQEGTRISYLAPVDGVMNVWVGPADDPDSAEPVTNDTDRGISTYFWAYTNEHILYTQGVYRVTLETGETTDLTPLEGVQAKILAVSQEFPDEILIAVNDRDPAHHDIHRLNITTGEQTLIAEDSRADVRDSMIHPTEKTVQAVAFTYKRKHWQIIDESIAGDLAYLKTIADGDFEVVSRTRDDNYWSRRTLSRIPWSSLQRALATPEQKRAERFLQSVRRFPTQTRLKSRS